MRFTCKTLESIPSTSQVVTQAPPRKRRAAASRRKTEEKSRKKQHSDNREARLESAAQSAKKKEKRADIAKHVASFHPLIYVGNLQASMTQWRLHEIFSKFGTITGIVIRRSGGQAVTVGVAIPSEIKGPKDRFYASIEFRKRSSVKSALRMDGKKLDNVAIVVSLSPLDLPEMKDIVEDRLEEMESRLTSNTRSVELPTMPGAFDTGLLTEPTFVVENAPPPKAAKTPIVANTDNRDDKHRMMGYSFAATVV